MKDETRIRLLNEYKMMRKVLDGLNGIGAIKDDKKEEADEYLINKVLEGKNIESTEEVYLFMDGVDEYTRNVNEFTEKLYKPYFYFYKNLESGELKSIHVSTKDEFERGKIIIRTKRGTNDMEKFYKKCRVEYFKQAFINGEEKAVQYMKKKTI